MTRLRRWLRVSPALALVCASLLAAQQATPSREYQFRTERGWLTMRDGVRLAVTYFRPLPRDPGETFPVILELLPYRKDDSFYQRDYPLYSYFARHGLLSVKVDIRGTGGSEGHLPPREYSEAELDDAVEIIRQLARIPGSNGAVGMWGISWGGFNALQVAMRRPPELKAIIALHASDDLFHDDVHYIDGALHIDPYALQIDHENGLPRTPDYPVDSAYFRERFEAYPWLLTYLKQPVDGEFWRRNAPRSNYEAIQVPCYLIGGLLDGYRDTVLRLLEHLTVPVKAEIGPWNHAWPDEGWPGPNYEWRARAVRWWDHWLRGRDTGMLNEPRLSVFVRAGDPPVVNLQTAAGQWRDEDWPITRTRWTTWYPVADNRLSPPDALGAARDTSGIARLRYAPGSGTVTGDWWGESTGDMRPDDAGSLVFDGPVLSQPVEVIGFPQVALRVSTDAELANWTVRLEDVQPDGPVSLVTGALINGAQRESAVRPERLVPGQEYDLAFPLHFTTWTFQPGHRIRLAVSNAQFPMIWPSPRSMTTHLRLGTRATRLELPEIPFTERPAPDLPVPEPRESRPDARDLPGGPPDVSRVVHDTAGTTGVEWSTNWRYAIRTRRLENLEREYYETHDGNPAASRFLGDESHVVRMKGRSIRLETRIDITSSETDFLVNFTRRIYENGRLVRTKRWKESIPREFH